MDTPGSALLRKRDELPNESLKREPSHAELAEDSYIIPNTLGSQVDSPGQ